MTLTGYWLSSCPPTCTSNHLLLPVVHSTGDDVDLTEGKGEIVLYKGATGMSHYVGKINTDLVSPARVGGDTARVNVDVEYIAGPLLHWENGG